MTAGSTPPAGFGGTIGVNPEHLELHATARRWVAAHVDPKETKALLDLDPGTESLPSFWDDLCALGWLGMAVEERWGGEGFGPAELAVVLDELGRACAPGPFLPTVLTAAVIQALGSDALRADLLPSLAAGARLGATFIPLATPTTTDEATLTARPGAGNDDECVLTGSLRPVLGGGAAAVLVVRARSADESGTVWCVLDADQPGVVVRALPSIDGTRRVAEVRCDGVVVPADRQLGPGADRTIAHLAATLVAAECAGGAAWCTETAAAYAAQRVQFGRPIGQFQAVKHRCADMLLQLEKARAAAWDAARAGVPGTGDTDDPGDPGERMLAGAVAAAIAPDAFFETAKECIQVLGGVGYTWEHDAHLYIKRATALRLLLGATAPWRVEVARLAAAGIRRSLTVELPPEAARMRAEVRAFVAETKQRDRSEWTGALADAGYLVPYWPKPWGRAAPPLEQLVIDEELDRARLRRPHLQVGAWVLPTLIAHATGEQQERWIRPTLHQQILWCQLFSEPEAGSDLASLATRATRDDERGGWVINGQKVWTTMAHLANWGILLARTDPAAPRHEGITCFVVDMASPGIEVRALRELTGAELFNEVFFDDVFVPDECVIGGEGKGWEAARTTLANERVSMGSGSSFGPGVESVLALTGDGEAMTDTRRDDIGALVADGQAIAVMGLRMTLKALAGERPGAEASVRKLLATEHEQRVQEIGLELSGPGATATDGPGAAWVAGFLGNRALSIAGGTSDIQRNVVAERLLGLPKDPEPGA